MSPLFGEYGATTRSGLAAVAGPERPATWRRTPLSSRHPMILREPVIVEGRAIRTDDHAEMATYAGFADAKYQMHYGVELYADPMNTCFRIEVTSVLGLTEDDYSGSSTVWETTR